MAFVNKRMDTCIAYGFTGGPAWQTRVITMDNGRELRNAQWLYPLHRYSASFQNIREDHRDEVLAMFHAMRGQLHCFRFKDRNDFHSKGLGTLAPSIGATTPAQLFKTYAFGGQTSSRIIQAPVSAVVKRNGLPVAGTLDTETGLFTPAAAWASGIYTWDGEFDVWVRFASDYNAFTIGNWKAHSADIELVEVLR